MSNHKNLLIIKFKKLCLNYECTLACITCVSQSKLLGFGIGLKFECLNLCLALNTKCLALKVKCLALSVECLALSAWP